MLGMLGGNSVLLLRELNEVVIGSFNLQEQPFQPLLRQSSLVLKIKIPTKFTFSVARNGNRCLSIL